MRCGSISPVGTSSLVARSTGVHPARGECAAERSARKKGEEMTISKERKAELTAEFGKNAQDTGNPKVQVAIATTPSKKGSSASASSPST